MNVRYIQCIVLGHLIGVVGIAYSQSYTRASDMTIKTTLMAPTNVQSAVELRLQDWRGEGHYDIAIVQTNAAPVTAYRPGNVPGFPFFCLITLNDLNLVATTALTNAYDFVYVVDYKSSNGTVSHYSYRSNLPVVTNLCVTPRVWLAYEALGGQSIMSGTGTVSVCVIDSLGPTSGEHVGDDRYLQRFYIRQRSNVVRTPVIIKKLPFE